MFVFFLHVSLPHVYSNSTGYALVVSIILGVRNLYLPNGYCLLGLPILLLLGIYEDLLHYFISFESAKLM